MIGGLFCLPGAYYVSQRAVPTEIDKVKRLSCLLDSSLQTFYVRPNGRI